MQSEMNISGNFKGEGSCRGFSPGDCNLDQDICDITLWLVEKFGVTDLELWVDRHHFQREYEIASFTVMMWPDDWDQTTLAATMAFAALGYQVIDSGAVVYPYQCCDGTRSKHDALRAYARIEGAIQKWKK